MTDKVVPTIAPIKVKEYEVKQSKYPQCGKLPARSIILGPSGSGKGVLLQNKILDIYRGCFERVYIFSSGINADRQWLPVTESLTKNVNLKDDEPELYYDHYDPESLEKIIDTQKKITEFLKPKKETKKLFQILIIIHDLQMTQFLAENQHYYIAYLQQVVTAEYQPLLALKSSQHYTLLYELMQQNYLYLV